jgi:hypothetical protein
MRCSLSFAWPPDGQGKGVSKLSLSCELMPFEQVVGRQQRSAGGSPSRPK